MHTKEIICWQCKAPNQVEDNAPELLEMLENLARWIGKSIADDMYSECVNPERAQVDLQRATEAIRKAKGE